MKASVVRRSLQLIAVSLVAILLMGAGDDARFNKLGNKMMCACGCHQILLACNHVGCTYSDRMRDELSMALTRGDSDDLVLQAFVQKYGPTVLAAPPATGFNLVAWVMPFAVFFSAMGFAVLVVLRWKQRAPAATPASASPELEAMRLRARRETEL
ncbi:MAG TPA: cytochrome c-type biogenesis protein CcmH [Terriglobales bacterium]|nr:cytochrome c-type biogenesis protein CcmH [Terriglobales bacterium]